MDSGSSATTPSNLTQFVGLGVNTYTTVTSFDSFLLVKGRHITEAYVS